MKRMLLPGLFFFRAGESYGRRCAQRELEARRMEARQDAVNLRRARLCWPQAWMQLPAALEQIETQQEMMSMMEQEVWMGADRLAMEREKVASLDTLVRLMLEGPAGLALGETYARLRAERLAMEREAERVRAVEEARRITNDEKMRDEKLTREMEMIGVPVGERPFWVR